MRTRMRFRYWVILAAASLACIQAAAADPSLLLVGDGLAVTVDSTVGGVIRTAAAADGSLLSSNHWLYTDRGIYGVGVYVGTESAAARVTRPSPEGRAMAVAVGTLCRRDGSVPDVPGALRYRCQTELADGSIRVQWSVTPAFSGHVSGFMAYIMRLHEVRGIFAKTADGWLLQEAATRNTRTFQAKTEPLALDAPAVGVVRRDDRVLVLDRFETGTPLSNVFFHEDGHGTAALFLALMDGGSGLELERESALTGGFRLRLFARFDLAMQALGAGPHTD